MSRSLAPAGQSAFLAGHYGKSVKVDGFIYEILHDSKGPAFNLRRGKNPTSNPLTWAFGSGQISQVYLTPANDTFHETHFSYFGSIENFDITPAQDAFGDRVNPRRPDPVSIERAAGRVVQMREARRCFGCHAANVPDSGPIAEIIPGVTCETCHGPGGNPAAAMRAGLEQGTSLIMNPARLHAGDRVDFCGACHVTSMDILMAENFGVPTVRFPAYRLLNSRCWRDDARIQCTGCHDPHKKLVRDPAYYDEKCLACHLSAGGSKPDVQHPGPACRAGAKDCVSCHMPKYEFPDVHHRFTDHDIRVIKEGAPFPG